MKIVIDVSLLRINSSFIISSEEWFKKAVTLCIIVSSVTLKELDAYVIIFLSGLSLCC